MVRRVGSLAWALLVILGVATLGQTQDSGPSLTGYSLSTVALDITQASLADALTFETELSLVYTLRPAAPYTQLPLAFSSLLTLAETQSASLLIQGSTPVGLGGLEVEAHFNVTDAEFDYLRAVATADVVGIDATASYTLVRNPDEPTPSDCRLDLFFRRLMALPGMDAFGIDVSMTLGDFPSSYVSGAVTSPTDGVCDLDFQNSSVTLLAAPFLSCDYLQASVIFGCGGFSGLAFGVASVELPLFPFLRISPSLSFTETIKQVDLRASVSFNSNELCRFDLNAAWIGAGGEQPIPRLGWAADQRDQLHVPDRRASSEWRWRAPIHGSVRQLGRTLHSQQQ